jgi:glycine/D-amino acid oxidase-like deaminating enzyme
MNAGNSAAGDLLIVSSGVIGLSIALELISEGATAGTVQVVTPGGTLNSNVVYTVKP